jgi:hypothetical protein
MTLLLTRARPARRRVVSSLAAVALAAAAGLGLTAWAPGASAGTVPPGARVLIVTPVFGQDPNVSRHHLDHAFTITDPAKVARIAGIINGLAPFPIGELSCTRGNGAAMRLTFRAGLHGRVAVTLLATYTGCAGLSGPGGRLLQDYTGSGQQVQHLVLAIAGVRWPYTPDVLPTLPLRG